MISYLKLSDIERKTEMQPRTAINMSVVEDYTDDMKAGAKFPPLTVFHVGEEYVLVDGFHRSLAAQNAGLKKIHCEVLEGSMRDAILYASGSNASHGFRRTNEDKRRAVERLLSDPEWVQWSDNKIAEICKVSNHFVGKCRNHTMNIPSMNPQPPTDERTFIHHKTGMPSTMNTENIGKKPDVAREFMNNPATHSPELAQTIKENLGVEDPVTDPPAINTITQLEINQYFETMKKIMCEEDIPKHKKRIEMMVENKTLLIIS